MTGNKTIDNAILFLALLGTMGCLGVFVYTEMIYQKPLPQNDTELANMMQDSKQSVFPAPFKLDPLIINVKSRKTRLRFLNLQVYIVPLKPNATDLFESKRAMINDAIIDVAGRMEPDELNSISGKILLEDRVKKAINQIVNKQIVKGLLFTKFVVQ
ncbi:flagellar basal body-associated protein FliL [Halobacteriovorax sp. HLS]|uniref:flagellar basal body-associated FliL family protein n=1 Tax=Halobacteriovorax sp. HLS TaxID=2234000 RepID=UPI000FD6D33F|nr:flagellar basal body-associated FliL family protein [Halobacteriovorax sp. HLS]